MLEMDSEAPGVTDDPMGSGVAQFYFAVPKRERRDQSRARVSVDTARRRRRLFHHYLLTGPRDGDRNFRHSFAIFIRRADGERIDMGPRRSNMSPQWSRN